MGSYTQPSKFKFKKSVLNDQFNLQRAVVSDWMSSTALWGHITAFF
jgi:hypothetical protein